MTILEVQDLCYEVSGIHGYILDCPIRENKRLTTTLGRVISRGTEVVAIEFSSKHLETATDESIKATVLHELAHALCTLDGKNDGHGPHFKAMCKRLGTSNDKAVHNNLQYKTGEVPTQKYHIYCKKCGKLTSTRSRACSVTKNPESYISKCCNATLKVVQNW